MDLATILLAALLPADPGGASDSYFPADPIRIEAEDAALSGLTIETSRAGYSGTGYVAGFDSADDSLTFVFTSETGVYDMLFAIAQPSRFGSWTITIDGVLREGTFVGASGAFVERKAINLFLSAGEHELVLNAPGVEVDYLLLNPVVYDPPTVPTATLADPQATPVTRALLYFMHGQYGRQIIAGQQNLSDVNYIKSVTGREPAMGAFDLIEYSPSRREHGSNPGRSSENWIDWASSDAIVKLMWHWNAPTDLINSQSQPWWRGFYTEATTFDFAAALADTSSPNYALLLRDIDAIAVQLKKFDDADIPVLWRPLHEAAGTWFWWGSKGPDAFIALWRLMFDRLVNHHGIHNLIWVYTHQRTHDDWYPGDDFVDIVSCDVYADDQSATMLSDWQDLQNLYGDRRLVTLSESGTLPDPKVITAYGIWWSWFALWTGDFIRGVDQQYLTEVFNSDFVMTRDELPNWRSTVSIESVVAERKLDLSPYPNPARDEITFRYSLPESAPATISVYDLLGRRRASIDLGSSLTGEVRLDDNLQSGSYIAKLQMGSQSVARLFTIIR